MNLQTKLAIDEKVQAVLAASAAEKQARSCIEDDNGNINEDADEYALLAHGKTMERRIDAEFALLTYLREL